MSFLPWMRATVKAAQHDASGQLDQVQHSHPMATQQGVATSTGLSGVMPPHPLYPLSFNLTGGPRQGTGAGPTSKELGQGLSLLLP